MLAMRDACGISIWPAARRLLRRAAHDPARALQRWQERCARPLLGRHDLRAARSGAGGALTAGHQGELRRMADGITVSNGLGWSPDGRTMYRSDTKAHRSRLRRRWPMMAALSRRRVFASFPSAGGPAARQYGDRPMALRSMPRAATGWRCSRPAGAVAVAGRRGAARDPSAGALPDHAPLRRGRPKTLYITTARENRPAEELAAQPLAGCVPAPGSRCQACRRSSLWTGGIWRIQDV